MCDEDVTDETTSEQPELEFLSCLSGAPPALPQIQRRSAPSVTSHVATGHKFVVNPQNKGCVEVSLNRAGG